MILYDIICMISMYRYVQYTFQCKKRAENRKMKKKRPLPIERPGNEPMAQWPNGPDRTTVLHGDFEGSGTGFLPWLSGELVSQKTWATYFRLRLGRNS